MFVSGGSPPSQPRVRRGLGCRAPDYLKREEAERLLGGESPVRVWREKRGMTQRALAEAASVAAGYLAEIEAGRKPGSKDALVRIADVPELSVEHLIAREGAAERPGLRPVSRSEVAAARLEKLAVALAERGVDHDRMVDEMRSLLAEWRVIADRARVRHQIKAAIGTLRSIATELSGKWSRLAEDRDRIHDTHAVRRL